MRSLSSANGMEPYIIFCYWLFSNKDIHLEVYIDKGEWSGSRAKLKTGNPGLLCYMGIKIDIVIVLKETM